MKNHPPLPITAIVPSAVILGITGWGGLTYLWIDTLPTIGPRWLFFFLSVLALTGTGLIPIAFLNQRFPTTPPARFSVILREAVWFGIFIPTLAWFQLGRVLTVTIVLFLAGGLFMIEVFLRLRERSRWEPQ